MELWEYVIPILALIFGSGSIVVVIIQHKYAQLREIREKLREDRRQIYKTTLYPFSLLFSKEENRQEEAAAFLKSKEFRENSIMLNLFGSDEVIRANNNLLGSIYQGPELQKLPPEEVKNHTIKILREYAKLLLAIRKSLVEEKTQVGYRDMVSGMITDLDDSF